MEYSSKKSDSYILTPAPYHFPTMSAPFGQHDGLKQREGLNEPMPLSEVLNGTTFVSATGRVYRLFGNEEESFSLPAIPPLPPLLTAAKESVPSLEQVLEQIESFSIPATGKTVPEPPLQTVNNQTMNNVSPAKNVPALHLFRALEESFAPRLVRCGRESGTASLSVREIVGDVSQKQTSKPKSERRQYVPAAPPRIVPDPTEEPFIIPFAISTATQEDSPQMTETRIPALKLVSEFFPPIFIPSTLLWQCWKRCQKKHGSKTKTLYRKPFSSPIRFTKTEETPINSEPKLPIDISTFHGLPHLDSLMQTANDQIRTLADHLVMQSNQGVKVIGFKSVFPGDGCSTILMCAARVLLDRHYRILLIDTHYRHLDLPRQCNLLGDMDLESQVIPLNDRLGLWVWQKLKTIEENRATLASIIADHRDKYDLILLDDGSITESPLMEFVGLWNSIELDGIILVSNAKRPTELPVSYVMERLQQHHIHLVGVMENYV